MTERRAFDGTRQRAVLRKLQRRAALAATEFAEAAGISYPQLQRYKSGQSPLGPDRLAAFARALNVSVVDLAAELAGHDVFEDVPETRPMNEWSFRDALRGHIPEDLIERLAPTWEGRPLLNQQAAVEAILEMAEEARVNNTVTKPRRNQYAG